MPPTITSTSGTWTHGQSVTISGSGFGSTGPVGGNLLLWDDFSNGIVGNALNANPQFGAWTLDTRPDPVYANDQSHGPGGKCSKGVNTAAQAWSNFIVEFAQKTKLYQSFWFRWNYTGNTGQMKLSQVHGNPGGGGDFAPGVHTGALDLDAFWWATYRATESGACDIASRVSYTEIPNQNTWYFFERIMRQSTAATCAQTGGNGYLEHLMTSGAAYWQQYFFPAIVTRENSANGWVETSFSHGMTNLNGTLNNWVADAYLSSTLARVIIGTDNATFGSATVHREIQRVTSWSDTSITLIVNRGSFGPSGTARVFVIDDDNVASSGFQFAWGAGGGGSPSLLGPPVRHRIVRPHVRYVV